MRPALDRLLARPSALRILRTLVKLDTEPSYALYIGFHGRIRRHGYGRRHASAAAQLEKDSNAVTHEENPRPISIRRARTSKALSWDDLHYQSDVRVLKPGSRLLVDEPGLREDFKLWVSLLQFRRRLYRDNGVQDIWDGLRAREIDLPTEGASAAVLWDAFLSHPRLKVQAIDYAADLRQREGRIYVPIYEKVVGRALQKNPETALGFHKRLVAADLVAPRELRRVVEAATQSKESLRAFRLIYLESKDRDIYDSLITALCQRAQYDAAIRWHQFLIRNDDRPSMALESKQLFRHDINGKDSRPEEHVTEREKTPAPHDVPPQEGDKDISRTRFSREMMNRLLGIAHAVAPKQVDDALCARLFATKAFPVEAVISGLRMFGTEALGPLALRELAARADHPYTIVQKIEHLKNAGISIGQTVFSRAIYKFAQENRSDMLSDLLSTDQHPDVLEDRAKQKELLQAYLDAEDWQQVHRTLAILTIFHADPQTESWNLLLRSYSQRRDLPKLSGILEDMRVNRIQVTEHSLTSLHHYTLRLRRPGKRPVTRWLHKHDDLRLIANIWRSILESGGELPPWRWREILRRYGMTGRLSELRQLILWLAAWYSPATAAAMRAKYAPTSAASPQTGTGDLPLAASNIVGQSIPHVPSPSLPTCHPAHPLRQIFRPVLQKALVEWGFKTLALDPPARGDGDADADKATNRSPPRAHHWFFGLRALQLLSARGVLVETARVRQAVRLRLWVLYGPGISKRKANRVARQQNPYSLEQFVGMVNKFWEEKEGERLFDVPEGLLEGECRGERRLELFVRLFGRRPWMDRRRGLRVDLGRRLMLVRRVRWRREGVEEMEGDWAMNEGADREPGVEVELEQPQKTKATQEGNGELVGDWGPREGPTTLPSVEAVPEQTQSAKPKRDDQDELVGDRGLGERANPQPKLEARRERTQRMELRRVGSEEPTGDWGLQEGHNP